MWIMGFGYVGMFIEMVGGNIICDLVFGLLFYGLWFLFLDNWGFDWEWFGCEVDFLWILYCYSDYFDLKFFEWYICKDIEVLLFEYLIDDFEQDICVFGYMNIIYVLVGQVIQCGELKMMIMLFWVFSDGFIGDFLLSVDDGIGLILNQNDLYLFDFEKLFDFGKFDVYFIQVLGVIWWFMVYDFLFDVKQNFVCLKCEVQNKWVMYYIEKVDVLYVFFMVGLFMFLCDDLFQFNGMGQNGELIFMDQKQFFVYMKEFVLQYDGQFFILGMVVMVEGGEVMSEQILYIEVEIVYIFDEKWEYFEEQCVSWQQEICDEEVFCVEIIFFVEMLIVIKEWWELLLKKFCMI